MGELLGIDRGAHVVHGEDRMPRLRCEPKGDRRRFRGVLRGIVDQNLREPLQAGRISLHLDARLDRGVELAATLEGHGIELERCAVDEIGEVDGLLRHLLLHVSAALVRTRQRQEIVHEVGHLLGLISRGIDPAAGILRYRVVRLQDLAVRKDHGERGLELMGGIGHEALLGAPGILDRLQHPLGQIPGDEEQDEHGADHDEDRRYELAVE